MTRKRHGNSPSDTDSRTQLFRCVSVNILCKFHSRPRATTKNLLCSYVWFTGYIYLFLAPPPLCLYFIFSSPFPSKANWQNIIHFHCQLAKIDKKKGPPKTYCLSMTLLSFILYPPLVGKSPYFLSEHKFIQSYPSQMLYFYIRKHAHKAVYNHFYSTPEKIPYVY